MPTSGRPARAVPSALAAVVLTVLAVTAALLPPPPAARAAAGPSAAPVTAAPVTELSATRGPGYVPLPATRVLDTRSGLGAPRRQVPAGGELTVVLKGRVGVPTSGVAAVAITATVALPAGPGYLVVRPSGTSLPGVSTLTFARGTTTSVTTFARLGTGGAVVLHNGSASAVDVQLDVQGFVQTGGGFVPVAPARVVDTRSGIGAPAAPLRAGGALAVPLPRTGASAVPATGVAAVLATVTVTRAATGGHLAGGGATVVTFPAGVTTSGTALLPAGGPVLLTTSASATDVVVDLVGYVPVGRPLVPGPAARVLDTRTAATPLRAGSSVTADLRRTTVPGVDPFTSMPNGGTVAAVVGVTAVGPTTNGYLTVRGVGAVRPRTPALTVRAGLTVTGLAVVPMPSGSDGRVVVETAAGSTHVVLDLLGFAVVDATVTWPQGQVVSPSVGATGPVAGSGDPRCPVLVSDDGRWVVFRAAAAVLPAPGGTAGGVLVRDLALGATTSLVLEPGTSGAGCPLEVLPGTAEVRLATATPLIPALDRNTSPDVYTAGAAAGGRRALSFEELGNGLVGGTDVMVQSPDGRWRALQTTSTSVPDALPGSPPVPDPNGSVRDVLRTDLRPGRLHETLRLGPGSVTTRSVSDDGRVAFTADAPVPGVPGGGAVVWDGVAYRPLNVTTAGTALAGGRDVHLSGDGRRAVFTTSSALVPADTNGVDDVYLRDLAAGTTTLLSAGAGGGASTGGTGSSAGPISDDGTVVVLTSTQRDLVPVAPLAASDVYRWVEGEGLTRVSVGTGGAPVAGASTTPWVTRDGSVVSFVSRDPALTGSTGWLPVVVRLGRPG